ncbi:MAG: T9SS type A sorting domain-containing protein [Saprospiraceae bacterium]
MKASDIMISPNPVMEQLNIEINGLEKGTYQASAVDLSGKILLSQKFTSSNDIENLSLNVSMLNSGTYMLVIQNLNGQIQGATRFQVLK